MFDVRWKTEPASADGHPSVRAFAECVVSLLEGENPPELELPRLRTISAGSGTDLRPALLSLEALSPPRPTLS